MCWTEWLSELNETNWFEFENNVKIKKLWSELYRFFYGNFWFSNRIEQNRTEKIIFKTCFVKTTKKKTMKNYENKEKT